MKKTILFTLLFISLHGFSQDTLTRFQNPPSLYTSKGYTHSVSVDLGTCRMLIMSGQVALDQQGRLVGKGDVGKQAGQVFTNIKNIVENAGGTMDEVVKISIYITDLGQLQKFRDVRDRFINVNKPPASTLVQVNQLFRDDILVEVEATAIIPKK